jgi:hypothetical protein
MILTSPRPLTGPLIARQPSVGRAICAAHRQVT